MFKMWPDKGEKRARDKDRKGSFKKTVSYRLSWQRWRYCLQHNAQLLSCWNLSDYLGAGWVFGWEGAHFRWGLDLAPNPCSNDAGALETLENVIVVAKGFEFYVIGIEKAV